jgi:hypothetical protein
MKIGETHSLCSEPIDRWSCHLTAITADVFRSKIISEQDNYVGTLIGIDGRAQQR